MWELIQAGGPVLYIIIACSIVALGFAIERFLCFRETECPVEQFLPPLEEAIKQGSFEEAMTYCEQSQGLIPQVLLVGLQNRQEEIDDIRSLLIDEIQIHALPQLEKYLGVLAIIARTAPMLGLLGTVFGMIGMFEVIGRVGLGDPQLMAEKIGLALVTTAGGLMVAIPVFFVHAYFRGKIKKFELDLYNALTTLLRLLKKRKEGG